MSKLTLHIVSHFDTTNQEEATLEPIRKYLDKVLTELIQSGHIDGYQWEEGKEK